MTYKMDMKTLNIFTAVCTVVFFTQEISAGLKIYYIRHAEGGHNVKADWEAKGIPKSDWPDYVGNSEMFTPKGEQQLKEALEKLKKYEFDFIATSPLWRARHTVIPYLKATGRKAEVWPELKEGTGMTLILSDDLPKVERTILNEGDPIHVPKKEREYFDRRDRGKRHYKKYPSKSSDAVKTAYMKHVTEYAIGLIKEKFGGTDKSILLVGHNSSGVSLLKLLLGKEPGGAARRGLDNVGIWMVEEQKDGSFELKIYNDEVFSVE